jgi:hypothetical protein
MKRAILISIVISACGPDPRNPGGPGDDDDDSTGDCQPGVNQCVGNDVVACNPDGTFGDVITDCGDDACSGGICQTECAIAAAARSYVGCEFWPVDLDNAFDALGART